MRRRSTQPVKRRKRQPPPMSLVWVDSTRLREQYKREYDKLLADLAKAKKELDYFHEHDLRGFTRWLNSHFGELLTEIRETSHRLQEAQQLLLEIEREVMYSGISHLGAYERVMKRYGKGQGTDDGTETEDSSSEEQQTEDFQSGFHRPDSEFENQFRDRGNRHNGQGSLSEAALGRLKGLYRAIVRRLHPDTQKEMTAQKLEWWHQAQAAYQARDAAQLEMLLNLCEIEEAGSTEKSSFSAIKQVVDQFRNSLRHLQLQLRKCRRDPAWNFSQRQNLTELKRDFGQRLKHDLGILKQEMGWMEQQLAAWAAQAANQERRPVYYRRRSENPFNCL